MRARFLLPILIVAVTAGCEKKGNSPKMREMYRCWEIGWQIIESCVAMKRPDCMTMAESWFDGGSRDLVVIDNNAAFDSDKERCAKTTGYGVWNSLAADDLTDDMADAIQELQAAVRSKDFSKIRNARARVRSLLGLP